MGGDVNSSLLEALLMTRMFHILSALALAATVMYGCASTSSTASNSASPAKITNGILTDPKSMTLYTFDRDVAGNGKSACNGECARNWLPFYAPAGAKASSDYQVITREDGKTQWAIKGKPLYYWPEDQEPGDKFGDGYNNLWRLVGVSGPVTVSPRSNSEGY